jgi:trans-2,3-dihydro-3-hydroxyanthranilate isomerase
MPTTLRYVVTDVFTDTPLTGNQLAVFTDARSLDEETMLSLAREMNYSESTFVLPPESGGNVRVRIFTPYYELPFAGHPTLGTAFVLGAPLQLDTIVLELGIGHVPVRLERDESGRIVFGRMQQPVPAVTPWPDPDSLFRSVGVGGSELPVERYENGPAFVFVALPDVDELMRLQPDRGVIASLGVTGLCCFAGSGSEWTLRMFWTGGEDPATGSAAGPLACHLARHGVIAWGDEIVVSQGAAVNRPSTLYARADGGDGLIDGVEVGGQAVVVARGEFRL